MWKYYTEWLTFLLLLAEAPVVSNRAVVFSWLEIQSEVLIIIIPCIYTSLEGGIWQTEVGKHVNLLTWDIRSCWTFVPRETPEENLEGDILLMTIHFTPCLPALQLLLESKQVHKLLSLFSCLIFIPPPVFFSLLPKGLETHLVMLFERQLCTSSCTPELNDFQHQCLGTQTWRLLFSLTTLVAVAGTPAVGKKEWVVKMWVVC